MSTWLLGSDPDALHDAIACGDIRNPYPIFDREAPTLSPRQLIERQRERAARLWKRLAELTPEAPPPTLPEVDDERLEELCHTLEQRIAAERRKKK
jgi:hypothetical protein